MENSDGYFTSNNCQQVFNCGDVRDMFRKTLPILRQSSKIDYTTIPLCFNQQNKILASIKMPKTCENNQKNFLQLPLIKLKVSNSQKSSSTENMNNSKMNLLPHLSANDKTKQFKSLTDLNGQTKNERQKQLKQSRSTKSNYINYDRRGFVISSEYNLGQTNSSAINKPLNSDSASRNSPVINCQNKEDNIIAKIYQEPVDHVTLKHLGANKHAFMVITKCDEYCKLQFLAVQQDGLNNYWAIPCGTKDDDYCLVGFPKPTKSILKDKQKIAYLHDLYKTLFINPEIVYNGYLDDYRNTETAWIEAIVEHYHHKTNDIVQQLDKALNDPIMNPDKIKPKWISIDHGQIYPSHKVLLDIIRDKLVVINN